MVDIRYWLYGCWHARLPVRDRCRLMIDANLIWVYYRRGTDADRAERLRRERGTGPDCLAIDELADLVSGEDPVPAAMQISRILKSATTRDERAWFVAVFVEDWLWNLRADDIPLLEGLLREHPAVRDILAGYHVDARDPAVARRLSGLLAGRGRVGS